MRSIVRAIDDFLNSLTMYRLLTYGLGLLAIIGLVFSLSGVITFSATGMLASLALLLVGCFAVNWIMSRIWRVPANSESWLISALILFFILPQATTPTRAVVIFLAAVIAMAGKYIVAWHGKHIFNPAAFAAATVGVSGLLGVTWWVGNSTMWPFVLALGLLVARKIRRFPLYASFITVSLATTVVAAWLRDMQVSTMLSLAVTSSPLLFLGGIMLTEPSTMPPRRGLQIIFGVLVAMLYAAQISVGGTFISPELALLVGNLFAFAVSPKYRIKLTLKTVEKISERLYNFVFVPDRQPNFAPGQYMEWTLANHDRSNSNGGNGRSDSRGNRRTFTIASSPTEPTVQLGVTFYEPSSSFKRTLKALEPGATLYAGQIAGNFTLPKDPFKKLVFVAGGIGITPFRSMLQYLIDTQQQRDIVLLYMVNHPNEVAYKHTLKQAAQYGVRIVPVVSGKNPPASWKGRTGFFNQALVTEEIPDYQDRTFYISGPQVMVNAAKDALDTLRVPRTHVKTDYFSGY